jgi:hypothetical protein
MTNPRTAVRWLAALAVAGAVAVGSAVPAQAATTLESTPTVGHHCMRPMDTHWNGT